jgi:hypothetical protein
MEHLLEGIAWLQDKIFLKGFVFGFVHVFFLILGYYSAYSLNNLLKIVSNGYIAGIFGAVGADIIGSYISAILDPSIRSSAVGILIGASFGLVFIPFLERYVTKSKHHISVGSHSEVKKDLDKPHR